MTSLLLRCFNQLSRKKMSTRINLHHQSKSKLKRPVVSAAKSITTMTSFHQRAISHSHTSATQATQKPKNSNQLLSNSNCRSLLQKTPILSTKFLPRKVQPNYSSLFTVAPKKWVENAHSKNLPKCTVTKTVSVSDGPNRSTSCSSVQCASTVKTIFKSQKRCALKLWSRCDCGQITFSTIFSKTRLTLTKIWYPYSVPTACTLSNTTNKIRRKCSSLLRRSRRLSIKRTRLNRRHFTGSSHHRIHWEAHPRLTVSMLMASWPMKDYGFFKARQLKWNLATITTRGTGSKTSQVKALCTHHHPKS